jgi:hypothetical protein
MTTKTTTRTLVVMMMMVMVLLLLLPTTTTTIIRSHNVALASQVRAPSTLSAWPCLAHDARHSRRSALVVTPPPPPAGGVDEGVALLSTAAPFKPHQGVVSSVAEVTLGPLQRSQQRPGNWSVSVYAALNPAPPNVLLAARLSTHDASSSSSSSSKADGSDAFAMMAEAWQFATPSAENETATNVVATVVDGNVLYMPCGGGGGAAANGAAAAATPPALCAVNGTDGSVVWRSASLAATAPPAASDWTLFRSVTVSPSGALVFVVLRSADVVELVAYAVGADTVAWRQSIALTTTTTTTTTAPQEHERNQQEDQLSAATREDFVVFAVESTVYAYAYNGTALWQRDVLVRCGMCSVTASSVLLSTASGSLASIDARSGALRWVHAIAASSARFLRQY